MERELEGEQKILGEQKNIDKANKTSQTSTKKRARTEHNNKQNFIRYLYRFFLIAHDKRKKESRTRAEKNTYI